LAFAQRHLPDRANPINKAASIETFSQLAAFTIAGAILSTAANLIE
jgi:hypothetical protein